MALRRNWLKRKIEDSVAWALYWSARKLDRVVVGLAWLPNKKRALGFFELGQLYRYYDIVGQGITVLFNERRNMPEFSTQLLDIYFEDYMHRCSIQYNFSPMGRDDRYLKFNDVFLVLDVERKTPTYLILRILKNEKPGYICLLGKEALKPWNYYKKLGHE